MVREICKDVLFLARKSEPAAPDDLPAAADLLDTLATCELAGHRPEAVAFGLQPFDYHSMTMNISPQAEAMLPTFCRKVVEELARRGICATPRSLAC